VPGHLLVNKTSIHRSILGCARFSMVTQARRVLCAATVSARLSDELKSQDWAGVRGRALCGGAPDLRRSALPVAAAKTSAVRPATELRRKALAFGGSRLS